MNSPARGALVKAYVALMALLALSVGLTFVRLGSLQTPASLLIAGLKACLVALIFMEAAYISPVIWLWVVAGLYWLAILLSLSLADYATRR